MKQIFIFFAEGFEEVEALSVVDTLRRAGITIQMVSITGKKTVTGAHGITITMDALFHEINFNDADGLVLPGGMPGTENLQQFLPLEMLLRDFYAKKKMIAAICAAPKILGNLGLLEGRKATCYPGVEETLKGATISNQTVVVDDFIITGRGVGVALDFALAIVKYIKGSEMASTLREKMVLPKNAC